MHSFYFCGHCFDCKARVGATWKGLLRTGCSNDVQRC